MTGKRLAALLCALMIFAGAFASAGAEAEAGFRNYQDALTHVTETRPEKLDVGEVRWRPTDLLRLKQEMGGDSELAFSTQWCGTVITQEDTDIILGEGKGVSEADIRALIVLCPNLKRLDLHELHHLSNDVMIPMLEEFPDIEFVWWLSLNKRHHVVTNATAYSGFNMPDEPVKIRSDDLELLKYCPGLKALDLGHNKITTLDWVRWCPDLEMLILGDNWWIEDITPLGTLKHLQFLEMFTCSFSDVSPLANCTELLDLNLSYCDNITDLSPLESLPALERFWGNHMKGLTQEEKDRFTANMPGTVCMFRGVHATSDGWRDHERYKHYSWCLKKTIWIPFDQPLPDQ